MRSHPAPMPGVVQRAAAIARGPHACPWCECPTWADPPVPWTDLRDYIVICDACERPVQVKVDRQRIARRTVDVRVTDALPRADAVDELLDGRGAGAFVRRTLAAAVLPLLVLALALQSGASFAVTVVLTVCSMLPAAAWGPAIVAMLGHRLALARHALRPRSRTAPAVLEVARWDQWMREERRRERERRERPKAVLEELERVLDERELRRVRALAEHGQVPPAHLDDLLRFRRSWRSIA